MAQLENYVEFRYNLDLKRRDHQKISYERRVYESVDDRSLDYVSKIDEKQTAVH